jgi:Putative transposase
VLRYPVTLTRVASPSPTGGWSPPTVASRSAGRTNRLDCPYRQTLHPHECIRRFLIHVLPRCFHPIRHYGLFATGNDDIARACELLHAFLRVKEVDEEKAAVDDPRTAAPLSALRRSHDHHPIDPFDLPQRRKEGGEGFPIDAACAIAEELQTVGVMRLD